MEPRRSEPCPECARLERDCAGTPSCLTHRGTRHLDGWGVCDDCVTDVDRMLGELLDLHALAPDHLEPASRGGGTGHGSDRPIGVNLSALDLAHGESLLGVLESWERWWREHWGLAPYGVASASRLAAPYSPPTPGLGSGATSRTLSGCVGFLRRWWPRAATVVEPPPDEFAAEVRALHRGAMNALSLSRFDLDPDPDAAEPPDYTVPCPGCGHTIGMRRAPRDGQPDTARINCERCGWHGTGEWLIRVAIASGARPAMSLHQVMAHYQVTERTVRRWVAAGRLELRRGMYRVNDKEDVG